MDALVEARLRVLSLQTAVLKAKGRRRGMPGDGDGDGIPNEGKKKGVGSAGAIAAKHLGIATLKTQNSDAKDFHQVAVWNIKSAIDAAFQAGGGKGAMPNGGDLAKVYLGVHTLTAKGSDAKDFHDLSVSNIKAALEEAASAGRMSAAGLKATNYSEKLNGIGGFKV